MVDIDQLASLISQARGPLLDRVTRQVKKFTGDGSIDVMEWLATVERVCELEEVPPEKMVGFLLDGEPARLYRRLSVESAKQWGVVRKTLEDGYATPMPVVYNRWHSLSLSEGGSLDGYVDTLERLAERLKVGFGSTVFRSKFYSGLPQPIYEWAIGRDGAYDNDETSFSTVLSRVRERMATRRALASRLSRPAAPSISAASTSGTQRPAGRSSRGGAECYRCGERGHRVRDCPVKQSRRPKQDRSTCWRCGSSSHTLRDCPKPPPRASCAGAEAAESSAAVPAPSVPVSAAASVSRRVIGWAEVDEDGRVIDRGEVPRGFYLEDVAREPAPSTRE